MNGNKFINCLACGYLSIQERGNFEICHICFWEDEGEIEDPDTPNGGPNGELSLSQARKNFSLLGAVTAESLKNVRAPLESEAIKGLPSILEVKVRQDKARIG